MSGGLAHRGPYGKKGYKLTLELTHGLTFGTIRERQFRAIAKIGSSALDELFCQPEFVKKGEVLCEFPCE